ncbi:MAG TPA: MarR family transcriptional regulator [Roseiarcus sp.]|nr:MarR family transcriptional regulator [Roseiarcus sp.]
MLERARGVEEGEARAFRLEDHLFFHFSQILARRTRTLNERLRPYGLDYPRWRVLAVLQESPRATMGRLAELTSVDRTTLTRTLGLMEKVGLVERRERESDRRSLAISLTAKGRRLFERILPLALLETDRALTGFSSEEIDALRERLKRMADNLKSS